MRQATSIALATLATLLFVVAPCCAAGDSMSYLDNGTVRIGVDLKLGGAITYFSPSKREQNVVNSFDLGRQIQMSHYAGPVPYVVGDKQPKEHWKHIGWNPIQTGDDFGHGSKILEHKNDGRSLYVRCRPMQWPLDNVPGECVYESMLVLDGSSARVHAKFWNQRNDKTQYDARMQELPAVYTNGPYHRLMTYSGAAPFTGDTLRQVIKPAGEPGPWTHWYATERWSALVDDSNWGLGIYQPETTFYGGGFAGEPGTGGPKDSPTGYMTPVRVEVIDHNIMYDYDYVLMLGSLDEIRGWVLKHAERPKPPQWEFKNSRQGWTYFNASDAGWPIEGKLAVRLEHDDPQLIGPPSIWQADEAPVLSIEAAIQTSDSHAQVFWSRLDKPGFSEQCQLSFPIVGDGQLRTYRVRLADSPEYRGAMVQLRVDPCAHGGANDRLELRSVRLGK